MRPKVNTGRSKDQTLEVRYFCIVRSLMISKHDPWGLHPDEAETLLATYLYSTPPQESSTCV